jgi:hypothetical protein
MSPFSDALAMRATQPVDHVWPLRVQEHAPQPPGAAGSFQRLVSIGAAMVRILVSKAVRRLPACLLVVTWLALLCGVRPVSAHGLAISELRLHTDGAMVAGEWDVPLHDARLALGLDPQVTGQDGWRDLDEHPRTLGAYLAARLGVTADGQPCSMEAAASPLPWDGEPAPVRVPIVAKCPTRPAHLELRCDLVFDRDPAHRAYYSTEDARVTHLGVFTKDQRTASFDVRDFTPAAGALEFIREGMVHIWTGLDHVLFLLALLLPAALVRTSDGWTPRAGLGAVAREVLKVVTAFTLAHSVTLCLSFFGVVAPPARWVEVAVALSVFAAAWNNVRPFLPGRAWTIAFAFGLVHGLAFAGALKNLALPTHARGLALAAFNVGVELGQLSIVAVVLPIVYVASTHRTYPRLGMGAGSLVIAWVAVIWALERGLGLSLLAG